MRRSRTRYETAVRFHYDGALRLYVFNDRVQRNANEYVFQWGTSVVPRFWGFDEVILKVSICHEGRWQIFEESQIRCVLDKGDRLSSMAWSFEPQ